MQEPVSQFGSWAPSKIGNFGGQNWFPILANDKRGSQSVFLPVLAFTGPHWSCRLLGIFGGISSKMVRGRHKAWRFFLTLFPRPEIFKTMCHGLDKKIENPENPGLVYFLR